jgi:predicted ester cyclase
MSPEDNLSIVEAGFKAVTERDVEAFLALLDPSFQLHLILKPELLQTHGTLHGIEGFRYYLNLLFTAFPDYEMELVGITSHGNMVYQQLVIHGTHKGEFELPNGMKIPPTGLRVNIPVEVYHTFDQDGRFLSSTGYANIIEVLKQFGR